MQLLLDNKLDVKELDNDWNLIILFSRFPCFSLKSSPSLIVSEVLYFVWYTCCLSRNPAAQEGSLSNRRPYLLWWSVWVPIAYIILSILFSWLLEQASRSSRYCLTLRSLSIYFFSTIIKTIVRYWFLRTFSENVFLVSYTVVPKYP